VTGYICLIELLVLYKLYLHKKKNVKPFLCTIIGLILVNLQLAYGPEPSPESLQQGGLMFVHGGLHKFDKIPLIYSVSYFNLGCLEHCLWR